jgi:sodium-dependent dicarboxylate transporter 2/3/5
VKLVASVCVALVVYFLTDTLGWQLRMALVLLVLAAGLWVTESMALGATSLLIALLQPLLGIRGFSDALVPFFDPVVVLLLGGFLLAIAVDKHDLDEKLGHAILQRLGTKPRRVVLGLMLTTAFLSCWISNTASAALMMTVAIPVANRVTDPRGNLQKIMVLGVAYAASLGGFMTLIGSPPNALAAAFLAGTLRPVSFLGWSLYGLPLALVVIFVAWGLLFIRFPTEVTEIPIVEPASRDFTGWQKGTFTLFLVAVVLWLTEKFHPLSASMVSLAVAVALFATGLLKREDVSRVDWNTLLLIGGGLSLGAALQDSGLATLLTNNILALQPFVGFMGIVVLLSVGTLAFSMVASNTVSAALFMPIAMNLAIEVSGGVADTPLLVVFAVLVAISSGIDFMLPMGTPPNAIAYSTERVSMRDMITTGVVLNLLSLFITLLLALYVWPWIPVI